MTDVMVLAVHVLSNTASAVSYGVALGAFLLGAAMGLVGKRNSPGLAFIGVGLAAGVFPTFWNTLAIS
jgi:hypothetical protein